MTEITFLTPLVQQMVIVSPVAATSAILATIALRNVKEKSDQIVSVGLAKIELIR
ncbi:hypothetical protein HALLA_05920 [Halostagnicola larsenii XH-48]|uniref:Uncharacterized protein n=1 Tax=Halostagnicola larsenii XH-48 TaxID=797299 RepID=W0JTW5_9EURY|nr:hypothetical protein HALLA_05920 [Halostagnicola larsenii XH-48]